MSKGEPRQRSGQTSCVPGVVQLVLISSSLAGFGSTLKMLSRSSCSLLHLHCHCRSVMAGGNGRLSIDKVVRKIHIFSIIQQPMIVISLKFVGLDCVALGQVSAA